MLRTITAALALACTVTAPELEAQELVGLWQAKRRFGPDARGPLVIERTGSGYTADMMGFIIPVRLQGGELWFELPNRGGGGRFRGKPQAGGTIRGFWFSAPVGSLGPATPLTLVPQGPNRWSGQVVPLDDEQTFYLLVTKQPDGLLAALLRNPQRDYGALLGVRGLVRAGNRISLVGRRGAQPVDSVLITGSFDSAQQVITLNFPYRGGTYDFRRDIDDHSGFYPRVQQMVDLSMDSINAPQVHSVLIARRGRLVVEEYFHGEHRGKRDAPPHAHRGLRRAARAPRGELDRARAPGTVSPGAADPGRPARSGHELLELRDGPRRTPGPGSSRASRSRRTSSATSGSPSA